MNQLELATLFAKHRREMGLSLFDVKKADGIFMQFDDDHDNKIEIKLEGVPEGAQVSLAARTGPGVGGRGAKRLELLKFDANKDRVVTMSEVENRLASVRKRLGYSQADFQSARSLMTRYDKDKSRFIDSSEVKAAVDAKQLPKDLVTIADANKDKKVSLAELAKYLSLNK